jgi:hypothetical protein
MSYEHRFYIVEKTNACYDPKLDKHYAIRLCMFELGPMEEMQDVIKKYPPTNHFIYEPGNGNEECVEDCYGDPLIEIHIDDMIWEIRQIMHDMDGVENKLIVFYEILMAFRHCETESKYNSIVCLHYGH